MSVQIIECSVRCIGVVNHILLVRPKESFSGFFPPIENISFPLSLSLFPPICSTSFFLLSTVYNLSTHDYLILEGGCAY